MKADLNKKLSLLKQRFEELIELVSLDELEDLHWRSLPKRASAEELLRKIHRDARILRKSFRDAIVIDGSPITEVGQSLADWYRETFVPCYPRIDATYRKVDPVMAEFGDTIENLKRDDHQDQKVKKTFDVGIDKISVIVEDFPDLADAFAIDDAWEVLESPFFDFKPDEWLERSRNLEPVLTEKREGDVPAHVRFRLQELYRCFAYGHWFSVFALARVILEYALVNVGSRYGIEPFLASDGGERKVKRLGNLVSDMADRREDLRDPMETIVQFGNRFLHPKKRDKIIIYPKAMQKHAFDAVMLTKHVVEEFYKAHRPTL